MSTREIAYSIFDRLSEEQLRGFIMMFRSTVADDDIPNIDTLEAIAEVEEMKKNPDKYKGYTDVDEMIKDLLT